MNDNKRITKVTQIIKRDNGAEIRIIAETMFGLGLIQNVDVMVHRRDNENSEWILCSNRPYSDYKSMSLDDYEKYGRSEMLRTATLGEIMKAVSMLGRELQSEGIV